MSNMTIKPKHLGHALSNALKYGVIAKPKILGFNKEFSEDLKINFFLLDLIMLLKHSLL